MQISAFTRFGYGVSSFVKATHLLLSIVLVLALTLGVGSAQVLTGTLTGTVSDATGAVIPAANVVITDTGTGKEYRVTTDAAGDFTLTNLTNGNYKVAVDHAGFSRTTIELVQVFASQTAKVNVKLEVAKTGTEVVVQAEQSAVQTESVELKDTVERKELDNIPLPTRNPLDLVKTFAGILSPNAGGATGGDAFVHGLRGNSTNLTQDGINVQDNTVKTSAFFAISAPIADSIGEMNVSVGGIGADGGFGAAQVSMVTQRGTNDFHGSAYWFERTSFLNANTWFNNLSGLHTPFQLQNRLGATAGGPVWIPKVYKGKNKTFVFGAYEAYREPRSQPRTRTVLTPGAETGQFTYTPSGGVPTTVNLLNIGTIGNTGIKPAPNAVTFPIYQKIVPQTGFTDAGCGGGDGVNVRCLAFNFAGVNNADRYTVRVDHQLTSKHALSFVWNQEDPITTPDFLNSNEPFFPNTPFTGGQLSRRQVFVWALQSVLTPTQTNEFRVGYQRAPVQFAYGNTFSETGGYQINYAGITAPIETTTNLPQGRNTPSRQVIDNYAWVKGSHQMRFGAEYHLLLANSFVDNTVFPRVTLGSNSANPNNLSTSTLPGISSAELTIANNIFNDITGLMSSISQGVNHTSPTSGFVPGVAESYNPIQQNWAAYWQDAWKVKRNLTIQYGVRFEYVGPFNERSGLILLPQNGVAGLFGPTAVGQYFNTQALNGSNDTLLSLQGSTATGTPITKRDWNNFGPFVGVAWSPGHDGKTSVRASFAQHFTLDGFTLGDLAVTNNTGMFTQITNSIPTGVFSTSNVPLPAIPNGSFPVSQVNNYYNVTGGGSSLIAYDPNLATPYVLDWSLGVQRELWKKFTIEARYVGNHAVKQYDLYNVDELDLNYNGLLQTFTAAQNNMAINTANKIAGFAYNGLPGQTPTPILDKLFAGLPASSGYTNSGFISNLSLNNVQTMFNNIRNSPTYFNNVKASFPVNFFVANPWASSAFLVNNNGWSAFNGLETEVNRRFTNGFYMAANYTFSKVLTNNTFAESQFEQTNLQSVINPRLDKFRAAFDVRHSFGMTFLYPIPVGRGQRFGANMNKILNVVASGWSVNGFTHWSSGSPLTITSGRNTVQSAGGSAGVTPILNNMTAAQLESHIGVYREGNGVYWLDPALGLYTVKGASSTTNFCTPGQSSACFAVPAPGQFGNLPILGFSGPHFFDQDAAIFKDTRIHERITFQIRLEGFDVFNNPNFGGAQLSTDSTTFGQLTSTVDTARGGGVTSRIVQWAARVIF